MGWILKQECGVVNMMYICLGVNLVCARNGPWGFPGGFLSWILSWRCG